MEDVSNHLLQNMNMHNRDLSVCPNLHSIAGAQAHLSIFGELVGQAPQGRLHRVKESFGEDFMLWLFLVNGQRGRKVG